MEKTSVKNYLIGGLTFVVAALAFGIEPVQRVINEATSRGTLKGVEKCMDYSKSKLISQDAVKATCVQSFHKQLYVPDITSGEAGPQMFEGQGGWGGTLKNKTPDHVITWIRILVRIYDADGTKQEIFGETTIWIDPLGETEFRVELPDLKREKFDDIELCELDEGDHTGCMVWAITDVMGLTI